MKKALVVVDFQNDFVTGSLGFKEAEQLEDKINIKIASALNNNTDLFFTFDTHFDNYLYTKEGKSLPVLHCQKGSWGHKLVSSTAKFLPNAKLIFEKNSFASIDLAQYLKDEDYDIVEFIGLVSNICVLSNAIMVKSFLPEAEIIVDASCIAGPDKNLTEQTLNILKGINIDVVKT